MAITPAEARSAKRQTESESQNVQWQIRSEMDGLRPHPFGIKLALTPG